MYDVTFSALRLIRIKIQSQLLVQDSELGAQHVMLIVQAKHISRSKDVLYTLKTIGR